MAIKELSFAWAYSFADRVVDEVRALEAVCVLDFLEPRESTFLEKAAHPSQATLLHSFIYNLNASDLDYSTVISQKNPSRLMSLFFIRHTSMFPIGCAKKSRETTSQNSIGFSIGLHEQSPMQLSICCSQIVSF